MLDNLNSDNLKNEVSKLHLSFRSNQSDYKDLFYDHITEMMKFLLLNKSIEHKNLHLNERNYKAIEQYIFENSSIVESEKPKEIDWDVVDDGKEMLRERIQKILQFEGKSEFLKPIINFTVDSFENSLIYNQLHPTSSANPWNATNHILSNGYLFIASDKKEIIQEYKKDIFKSAEEDSRNNIGIITKTNKSTKKLSGFILDNRHNIQAIVFEFLREYAIGVHNSIGMKEIVAHLREKNIEKSEQAVREKALIPLKRAGLIGSYSKGFFFINSVNDLRYTYKSHLEKKEAIERTLRLYIEKGNKMGIDLFKEFDTNLNDLFFEEDN